MPRRIVLLVAILFAGCGSGVSTGPPSVPPTPASSAAAAPSPPGAAFRDIALTGQGKAVATFTIPADAAAIAVISHDGMDTFAVDAVNASRQRIETLVNTTGAYRGTVALNADVDLQGDEYPTAFVVDGGGTWTITIKPLEEAPAWDPATTLSGAGDQAYQLVPWPGGPILPVELAFSGDGAFRVAAYGSDGRSILADAAGTYSGRVGIAEGTFLVSIRARSGTWSITPD
jgi:hypothetical protein